MVVDIVVIVAPVVAVVVVSVALVFIIEVVVVTVAPVVIVDVVVVAGSLEQSLNAFQDILALQHVSTDWNPVSHDLIFPPHDGSPSQSRTHLQFHCRCTRKMMRDLYCATPQKYYYMNMKQA